MLERTNTEAQIAGPETGDPCACSTLRKAARAVTQLYDEALRPSGIRATQFTLLTGVRAFQPVTIKRLAEAAVMDRTTLTRNLRPLQRLGLVQVAPGRDRRERRVSLTPLGEEVHQRSLPLWREAQHNVREAIGSERLSRLMVDLSSTVEATRSE